MLNTSIPAHFRTRSEDEPASVIHAPQGYMNFVSGDLAAYVLHRSPLLIE
jgi:hypothetical protein